MWQSGLAAPFTLPEQLPPLRLLLVWDNLAGHKTPEMVLWLCRHGIMPLYTPLGGSWLNMAEAIQRLLKRRALDGQQPHSPAEIGTWFEQTGLEPTAYAVRVAWQASATAAQTARRRPPRRWLRGSDQASAAAPPANPTRIPKSTSNDPLVGHLPRSPI